MEINSTSVVVITGASSGLGAALAVACGTKGATTVLVARREDKLREVADAVSAAGGRPQIIVADVSKEAECYRVIDAVAQTHGIIDVLINNAGRGNLASVEDTPTEQWHSMFAVNVDSVFWCTTRALPIMRNQNRGSIIAISSVAGKYGHPYNAAYVAAKHAVVGFIAALRTELVGSNINATVICPAGVSTEWADVTEGGSIGALYGKAIPLSRTIARERDLTTAPLSRMMTAQACAAIILEAIEQGRTTDIFTHQGTALIAQEAARDRCAQEDQFEALWLAMRQVYTNGA